MDLKDIYTGLPVKHKSLEGTYEVQTIDDYSMSVWCRKLNSVDFELKEFKVEDLKKVKRG